MERIDETGRLCRLNLAVHGLEGDIRHGGHVNSYYDDPHNAVGTFDFVLANPPFNVNAVDKERLADMTGPGRRFPFGLPKPDNANTLWIQLFYSALNETGRAGFVMANSASDARGSEQDVRQQLIEAQAVDVMVAVGSNMFYTVTLPCTLWFLDRGKAGTTRADQVLFIDARNIYRQVDRAHRDWASAQIGFIANIVRLYRGEKPDYTIGGDKTRAKLEEIFTPQLAEKKDEDNSPDHPSTSGRGDGGEGIRSKKTHKSIPPEHIAFARKLRQQQTDAEKLMWYLLRDRRLAGFKFRRQHPFPPYVLDFYCHEARLCIELDGGQHATQTAKDTQRDQTLKTAKIRTLRFWNHDVLQQTENVLEAIWSTLTLTSPKGRGVGNIAYRDIPGLCKVATIAGDQEAGLEPEPRALRGRQAAGATERGGVQGAVCSTERGAGGAERAGAGTGADDCCECDWDLKGVSKSGKVATKKNR